MVIYDFDPNNLPDDYLKAIGLVVVSATETENVMRDIIGAMLGIDNVDSIALCTQMPFPLKGQIVRALNELKAPKASEMDELDGIFDRVEAAVNKRNAIAHSSFPIHPETKQVYRLKEKARGTLSAEMVEVKVEEIVAIAKEIHESGLALMEFMTIRGLGPRLRTTPLREAIARGPKASEARRQEYGESY